MLDTDYTQRFLFDDTDVRGEWVGLERSYAEVLAKHAYPEQVAQLLGELLAAAALLVGTLKFDGLMVLQARSSGAVPLLMVECSSNREMRGIARYDETQLTPGASLAELMPDGVMAMTIDPAQGQRYQGIVALDGVTLADSLSNYFASSEQLPTRFWLNCSDDFMYGACFIGLALSILLLFGIANAPLLAILWIIYISFVNVGQTFYGFGWEIMLLETTFLAVFLCPPLKSKLLPESSPPPVIIVWLLRWLLFRCMFGAGLIKIRGDACWRDWTCMMYHYETQPIPNVFSWFMHQAPAFVHEFEVRGNHIVELLVPWMFFGPRLVRRLGAGITLAFQIMLYHQRQSVVLE